MKSRLLSEGSKDNDSDSGTGLSDVEETFSDEMLLIKEETKLNLFIILFFKCQSFLFV